ncbi:MAG: TlpA disulfide reductase family protein [Gemmatimonadaceae bacterium]
MKRFRLRVPHWTTLLALMVFVWALPRLLPHLKALAGIRIEHAAHPVFAVHTLDGIVLSQDSLRGRVVLINVWATWCLPCRAEMPLMESSWQQHRNDGLVILGASVDRGDPRDVQTFVSSRNITYPIAIVDAEFVSAIGGVLGYPTSILIGRDGTMLHKVMGPIGPLTLEPAIRRALADTLLPTRQRSSNIERRPISSYANSVAPTSFEKIR